MPHLSVFQNKIKQIQISQPKQPSPLRYFWLFIMVLLVSITAQHVQAFATTNRKLNEEMQHQNGDVLNDPTYQISPDGQFVVFIANTTVEHYYLYSAPIDGSAPPTRLGAADKSVYDFKISPDSNWVVYLAQSAPGLGDELFRIPISGGTAVSLTNNLGSELNIWNFAFSPDGSHVAFSLQFLNNPFIELFHVPISGGTATRLYGNSNAESVGEWEYSNNDQYIVFYTRNDTDDLYRMFSVNVYTEVVIQLSDPFPTGGYVNQFKISPDSNHVIYVSDHDIIDLFELYSVPIAGGENIKLNGPLISSYMWYEIAPNSAYVVYASDQIAEQDGPEIWSVPIDGGTPIQINKPFDLNQVPGIFKISPDSTTVVYHAPNLGTLRDDLYSVPIVGGTATKLNEFANALRIRQFDISSDNARVVYKSDVLVIINGEEYLDNHIYSTPLEGGGIILLTENLNANVREFVISHTNDLVFFSSHNNLFCVGITGGPITDFEIEMVPQGDVSKIKIDPSDTYVVYRADQDTKDMEELYVAFGKDITAITLQETTANKAGIGGVTAVAILFLSIITLGLIIRSRKFS